jgi:hypothetical protein
VQQGDRDHLNFGHTLFGEPDLAYWLTPRRAERPDVGDIIFQTLINLRPPDFVQAKRFLSTPTGIVMSDCNIGWLRTDGANLQHTFLLADRDVMPVNVDNSAFPPA